MNIIIHKLFDDLELYQAKQQVPSMNKKYNGNIEIGN